MNEYGEYTQENLQSCSSARLQNPSVQLRFKKSWLVDMGCWQWDIKGLDSCCWPGNVVLSYSWSSSIHSFTPEAWLVCCRGLRLLLSTMSEHMQLSLALCRIGLYTVRKMHTCCHLCVGERQGCSVCSALDWILLVSPRFNLVVLWNRYWPSNSGCCYTVAWSLNGECAPFHSSGCSHNIKVEQVDVSTVRCKWNLQGTSCLCLCSQRNSLLLKERLWSFFFLLQLLATGLVNGCSSGSLKYRAVMNGSWNTMPQRPWSCFCYCSDTCVRVIKN